MEINDKVTFRGVPYEVIERCHRRSGGYFYRIANEAGSWVYVTDKDLRQPTVAVSTGGAVQTIRLVK